MKPMYYDPDSSNACEKRQILITIIAAIILVIAMAFVLDYFDLITKSDSKLIKRHIDKLGFPDIAAQTELSKTDQYRIYASSIPVIDKDSGQSVYFWSVYDFGPSIFRGVFPYPLIEKNEITFKITEQKLEILEAEAASKDQSVEEYLASIPWLLDDGDDGLEAILCP